MMEHMMNLKVFGYQQSSLIDYPGEITSIIFLNGCNLKCPYCHNKSNMIDSKNIISKDLSFILDDIKINLCSAITITGGEPTLQENSLINLLKWIKINTDKKIKLDTNGTNPIILKRIISNKLVDFVAMDIKSPFNKYQEYFKFKNQPHILFDSVNVILKSGIKHQFRTTEWSNLTEDDKKWIKQHFKNIKWQKEIKY